MRWMRAMLGSQARAASTFLGISSTAGGSVATTSPPRFCYDSEKRLEHDVIARVGIISPPDEMLNALQRIP